MKHVLILGTDFRSSSLKMREAIHLDDSMKPRVIRDITKIDGIDECVILTTCNRVEIYTVSEDPIIASKNLVKFLSKLHGVPVTSLASTFYFYRCHQATRHLFRVCCGLESMVVGEVQILGQVRKEYQLAKKSGGTGPIFNKLFQTAIALGKRVRHDTLVSSGVTSIASAAARLAAKITNLNNSKIGVVGCGEMGNLIVSRLRQLGASNIVVTNRGAKRGQDTAKEFNAEYVNFDNLDLIIKNVDLLITATSANEYIVNPENINKEIKLIDIGTPRNINPEVTAELYSIDDLKDVIEESLEIRLDALQDVEELIENKISFYKKWYYHKNNNEKDLKNRKSCIEIGSHSDWDYKKEA